MNDILRAICSARCGVYGEPSCYDLADRGDIPTPVQCTSECSCEDILAAIKETHAIVPKEWRV